MIATCDLIELQAQALAGCHDDSQIIRGWFRYEAKEDIRYEA